MDREGGGGGEDGDCEGWGEDFGGGGCAGRDGGGVGKCDWGEAGESGGGGRGCVGGRRRKGVVEGDRITAYYPEVGRTVR